MTSPEPAGGDRILTRRLELVPLVPQDAEELARVLGDRRLHDFIGGQPATPAELRARYVQLAAGHSADGTERWRNWIVRLRADRQAVGTVQATITGGRLAAEIAWVIGVPWQGRGIASEAAAALVGWLEAQGTRVITAHIHPDHHASAAVASRAGLQPTDQVDDGERLWRRAGGQSGANDPVTISPAGS